MDLARCKGRTQDMFPKHKGDQEYVKGARELCGSCPVSVECLDYALSFPANDMHGVWAGLTPRELMSEQRRRRIEPSRPSISDVWKQYANFSKVVDGGS